MFYIRILAPLLVIGLACSQKPEEVQRGGIGTADGVAASVDRTSGSSQKNSADNTKGARRGSSDNDVADLADEVEEGDESAKEAPSGNKVKSVEGGWPSFVESKDLFEVTDELKQLANDSYYLASLVENNGKVTETETTGKKAQERLLSWQEDKVIFPFSGLEADQSEDAAMGFIHVDTENNVVTISFHGTRSGKLSIDYSSILSSKSLDDFVEGDAGWSTNFKTSMKTSHIGDIHEGFYNKYMTGSPSPQKQIDQIVLGLLKKDLKKDSLRIRVTGHSQGASVAAVAFLDLCDRLKSGDLWELPAEDNSHSNRIHGYFISPAAITRDEKSFEKFNELGGAHNAIAHYNRFDPVSNVSLEDFQAKTAQGLLKTYSQSKGSYPLVPGYHFASGTEKVQIDPDASLTEMAQAYLKGAHFGSKKTTDHGFDPDVVPKVEVDQLKAPSELGLSLSSDGLTY